MHPPSPRFGRLFALCLATSLALTLAACGGGGGGSGDSRAVASAMATFPPSMAKLGDANVVPVLVQAGPGRKANIPMYR